MNLLKTFMILLLVAGCAHKIDSKYAQRSISSQDYQSPTSNIHGLKGINLDPWIEGFFKTKSAKSYLPTNQKRSIVKKYQSSDDVKKFYEAILDSKYNVSLSSQSAKTQYYNLAQSIFAAKKEIHKNFADQKKSAAISTLLTYLGEEVLYAAHIKFPGDKLYKQFFDSSIDRCGKRVGSVKDIPICNGDVFLSKGAAGTSSFLARISDHPENFSHSTVAYVDSENDNRILMPEAEIEDGVKLRDTERYYEQFGMYKFYIYRYRQNKSDASRHRKLTDKAVDSFIKTMNDKVDDPMKDKVWKYDFAMDPTEMDEALYCSEVAYAVYKMAKIDGVDNPYSKQYWSTISGGSYNFLSNFLNIKQKRFPAPGDIEKNPNFDMVAIFYDFKKMQNDRITTAMVDVIIEMLNDNSDRIEPLLDVFANIDNTDYVNSALDIMMELPGVDGEKLRAIKTKLPEDVGVKQLVFFGILDHIITPKVREKLQKAEQDQIQYYGRPYGPNELRTIIQVEIVELFNTIATMQ